MGGGATPPEARIEKGYELPAEAVANVFELTDEELAAERVRALPESLQDALREMGTPMCSPRRAASTFEWFLGDKRSGVAPLQRAGHAVRDRAVTCARCEPVAHSWM